MASTICIILLVACLGGALSMELAKLLDSTGDGWTDREVDFDTLCLREYAFGNCRCSGCKPCSDDGTCNSSVCCQTYHFRSLLTCCEDITERDPSDSMFEPLGATIKAGSCSFLAHFFDLTSWTKTLASLEGFQLLAS